MNNINIILTSLNFYCLLMMLTDKVLAIKNKHRISEKSIFSLSILGGSLGSYLGMFLFHHKTNKKSFKNILPILILIHIIIYIFLLKIIHS